MTHTSTEQPEALRLAECLERDTEMNWPDYDNQVNSAAELRRLHARVQELEASQAQRVPLSDELPQGFLSDVLTAAGLVRHGKQCKALGSRIGEAVEEIWKISIQQREAISAHGITQEKHG